MGSLTDRSLGLTELANGIRVVTDPMPTARSVTTGVWVGVGGRDEPEHLSGASHFLEHLLFKGTEHRSARSIAEEIDAVGGEFNAHTSREYTAFHTRLPDHAWRDGVELLGDVVTAPAFRERDVEAERQVILEEILMSLEAPDDQVHQELALAMFGDHPLGREVLGSPESVGAITRDQIAEFFADRYRPANLVVVGAGNLDHAAFADAVDAALGHLDGGVRPERRSPAPPTAVSRVVERGTEQVHVALGWRALSFDDDDRYALAIGNQLLGGGTSSRLFQEVREERGLAYSVFSHSSASTDCGTLTVYAGTTPRRADELVEVLDAELERLVREGCTDREVEIAAGYLEGATVLALEDSGGRMARVGRTLMHTDDVLGIDEQVARLRRVSTDDVGRVLAEVLSGPRAVSVVGPVVPTPLAAA